MSLKQLVVLPVMLVLLAGGLVAGGEAQLEERFRQPPAEARPWCYWYWMNGNITREGIVADLQGFADVGIGGVMAFDIGIHPAGSVTNRSPQWYELVRLAVSEAAKRGIKVSFHCPGWSASGGPWVTPELGMQELTWSETGIEGPREFTLDLPKPPARLDCYRDAAIVAFPTPSGDEPLPKPVFRDLDGKILPAGAAAVDDDTGTTAELPAEFEVVYPRPVSVRSVFVRGARASGAFTATMSVQVEAGGSFKPVATFRSLTSGPFSANIGSGSFEAITASSFRFDFGARRRAERIHIERLELFGGFRVSGWTGKAGFATDRMVRRPGDAVPLAGDVIELGKVVDLTGRKSWAVPAGRWTILRIGYTPTGVHISPAPMGGDGLECDKLSREAADFHYDRCMVPMLRDFGSELVRQAVAFQHVDSYEAGWQNWTVKFPQEFSERRGYDIIKYMPALTGRVVGDVGTTEKFLWDFRRTVGDLFADNHYGQLAKRSHEDGLGFSTEPYGGPFEFLQVGLRADHPMVEFWLPTRPQGRKIAFEGVFAGRTAGRQIIGAESFTSGPPEERWNSHPYSLKALGDFIYCSGVNRFVIHVSAHQPLVDGNWRPGYTCGCNGIHFDRGNTWWQHGAKEWGLYLTRCQSLLQAGEHVADVLYFQGNHSPDGVGPYEPLVPEGYDFDACNSEVLAGLAVRDGRLVLPHGRSYAYLVLPRDGLLTLASLRKVAALAEAGARIAGAVPKESPSLSDAGRRDEYENLALAVEQKIIRTKSFKEIFAADRLAPDFEFDEESGLALHAIHRKVGEADVYFVASASAHSGSAECVFRVAGKVPELWRADKGTIEACAVYEQAGGTTRIPLTFDPAGSVFVVFRQGVPQRHALRVLRAAPTAAAGAAGVQIRSARYGVPNEPQRMLDVTRRLAGHIRDGQVKFKGFEQLAGDPAPGVVKVMRVEYCVGGKAGSIEVRDGDTLRLPPAGDNPPAFEVCSTGKRLELTAFLPGRYSVVLPDTRTQVVEVATLPEPQMLAGPWTVAFPSGGGAPEKVNLEKLISWTEHAEAGVKYFSGTAVYRKTFSHPAEAQREPQAAGGRVFLDLGVVEVIAEVWLNGKSLGTLWKPPFCVDVTDVLREGLNELEVRVTNLWPNRLIGDEQFADDCAVNGRWAGGGIRAWPGWLGSIKDRPEKRRQTFFTWKHWSGDEQLLPSGLIGPVRLVRRGSVVLAE